MRLVSLSLLLLSLFVARARCQQVSAPEPQPATIAGIVTDGDGRAIAGAAVTVDGTAPEDHHTARTTSNGAFLVDGLRPAMSYRMVIKSFGFADWTSPASITLTPGERRDLPSVKLAVSAVESSVAAVDPEKLATEQIQNEEHQRILGIIPNFYVVYDSRFVPLSTKLKFQLAFRASIDAVNIAGSAVLAGINQAAASTPDYRRQGVPGYAERFGAAYAGSVSDVMIGGAILPSLFHQDPRYFYKGTGSKKSRALHAMSAPFICKGDDGSKQFNYSSIGGDLITGALQNAYFPSYDRGPGLVFTGAALDTAGRVVNALFEEFVLNKFTTKGKNHN